jgi:tetratricopeptide (TPR) repeat protein
VSFFRNLLLAGLLLQGSLVYSQPGSTGGTIAGHLETGSGERDLKTLRSLYETNTRDNSRYAEYFDALIRNKDYKAAIDLATAQQRLNYNPTQLVDLGRAYAASGKEKKAVEQYDAAVRALTGEEMTTQQLATAFSAAGREDYTIKVYEQARALLQNPFVYAAPLARLYARTGDVPKAIEAIIVSGPGPNGVEDIKASILEMIGDDDAKLQQAQKAMIRKINLQPDNVWFADLLTWLYTQRGDWEGARIQVEAIDARSKGNGQGLLQFAQLADKEGQHDIARKTLDAIIEKGTEHPFYTLARAQRLAIGQRMITEAPVLNKADVKTLEADYEQFLRDYPQYHASDLARDYAALEAEYNDSPAKAIRILEKSIAEPTASREFAGRAKLQLGDYLVLQGQVWEASLKYSQVDKAFREDMLGEDARFRNGRLAYYRGDFGWAQGQLSVLKASTSELIANDALNLSVLITENTPDSNNAALLLFARADLLLFRHQYDAAIKALDSINTLYPKHPLQDDVLMLRATLAQRQGDFSKALEYLASVYTTYGKDVLADDAVFRTAEIYDQKLKKPADARKFYEQLIIDYPGSTYVQRARARLAALDAAAGEPGQPKT